MCPVFVPRIVCLLFIAFSGLLSAEVFRWVDEQGGVHYSDKKPDEEKERIEKLEIKQAPREQDPQVQQNIEAMRQLSALRDKERERDAQTRAQQKAQQQELAVNCQRLLQEMDREKETGIVFSYDEEGNRVNWSGEERKAYRAKMQDTYEKYCL